MQNRRNTKTQMNRFYSNIHSILIAVCLLLTACSVPAFAQQGQGTAAAAKSAEAASAALVTEFDVNGLKVLLKKRAGSQTVATGLFIRGGARNITKENAGIESLMLGAASEASANFPRERMRAELARMGTQIGSSVNYDYSA
ncbi:MAG: insulinase family protein, partial [Pyrinomonadaceae bacterium]